MPTPDHQIAALWIGGELSYLEQLCLKSFLDVGHHVKLYSYEPVGRVPDGVECADAAEILPLTTILRHGRTGSPAPQADRFRYCLLAQCDRTIWADTDAYCVRRFETATGHFFGWESARHINNGVLGLPRDSEALAGLVAFTADPHAIPEWFDPAQKAELEALKAAGTPRHAGEMVWGVWGPRALTHYLTKSGEARHALPRAALYPFAYKDRALMLRPGLDPAPYVTDETFSIHFYGRRMRARLREKFDGVPRPRSLIGQLLKRHGIDPAAAPLPAATGPVGTDGEEDDEG